MSEVGQTDTNKSSNLISRLRQRLVTVPKPGAKAFKPTYPLSYTYNPGTVHKPGDSAGYQTFNPTVGACAAGYDPTYVMAIEHVFAVDPLCEEAARALERLSGGTQPDETSGWGGVEKLAEQRNAALAALEMLYDKWEEGDPCYEDADPTGAFMGNAVKLSQAEEDQILALIPKQRSAQNGPADSGKP